MTRITFAALFSLLVSGLSVNVALAQDTDADERPILTLMFPDADDNITLTEEDLLAYDQVIVRTENEFVDGMAEFSGPLVRDVLKLFDGPEGAESDDDMAYDEDRVYIMTAVNEYSVEIPAEDFVKYDVIFAMSQDYEKFSLRTKGPIWVIYPMSDHAEIRDRILNDRLIWQLASVKIK